MQNSRLTQLKDKIPQNVKGIISTLEKNGFEAYVVGGCVRDAILGKEPHDWDITTNATPEEVHRCFHNKHIIDTGLQHGTVTVMAGYGENRDGYEITTYRIDGDYSDGRHPDSVKFTKDIKEDLSRRDFTINAMAYNPNTGIVDPFHGYEALTKHTYPEINCVGNAEDRFSEDSLRILRGIRFIAKFNASVSSQTCDAMMNTDIVDRLTTVSQERKTSELLKMLETDRPYIIMDEFLFDKLKGNPGTHSNIVEYIIPYKYSINMKHNEDNIVSIRHMKQLPIEELTTFTKDSSIRLALFLLDTDIRRKDIIDVLKGMKLPNNVIKNTVNAYSFFYDTYFNYSNLTDTHEMVELKKLAGVIGKGTVKTYLDIEHLFTSVYNPIRDKRIVEIIENFQEAVINKEPMSLKDLQVSGNEIKEIVDKPDDIGIVLNGLMEEVLYRPHNNNKEYLMKSAEEIVEALTADREEMNRE